MIRTIRILGAALGAFVGLGLAAAGTGLFVDLPYAGFMLAAWTIAWMIVGFAVLPYLTVVPAALAHPAGRRSCRPPSSWRRSSACSSASCSACSWACRWRRSRPARDLAAAGHLAVPRAGDDGPDRGQAGRPVAAAESAGLIRRAGAEDEQAEGDPHVVVDTSVLIDGRIAEIVESGFLYGTLVVPRFVLEELQHIADSLGRRSGAPAGGAASRSCRGCSSDPRTPVEIVEDVAPGVAEVDAKLVELAKRRSRVVLTNDFNLNRVAELQGVRVMNINSLANAVKPAVLPGEELRVKVIQEGKEAGQGVGFLDDGTMIVVEGGARLIDREVDVSVTRVLQTVAGRMIFAQPRLD